MSRYFTLEELTRSSVAAKYNIDNTPDESDKKNLNNLMDNVLDPVRVRWGGPITVSSGFRSKELNEKVGGVSNSQHLNGTAADLQPQKCDKFMVARLYNLIVELDKQHVISCDQVIIESKAKYGIYWVHVSSKIDKTKNRHQYMAISR